MLNLTDPALAPLVARYRAWVEAENQRQEAENEQANKKISELMQPYEERRTRYEARPGWLKAITPPPSIPRMSMLFPLPHLTVTPTYQGFLDWAIREGIEVPKGGV
jgi:hypothetical protein